MKSDFEFGGLKAPDIITINKAIKLKSLLKLKTTKHPISTIYNRILKECGFNWDSTYCPLNPGGFLGTAINTNCEINKRVHEDIGKFEGAREGIHKNYYSVMQNTNLISSKIFNIHQINMLTRLKTNNINTAYDLQQEKINNQFNFLFLDVHQIYNSLPRAWRGLMRNTRRKHQPITDETYIGVNKWKNNAQVLNSDIIKLLNNTDNFNVTEFLSKKHKIDNLDIKNPFTLLRQSIKDVRLRNLQFKMLHNIYPTMKHLHRWKLKDTDKCSHCNEIESLNHAVVECNIAKDAFKKVGIICSEMFLGCKQQEDDINLCQNSILFGLSATNNIDRRLNRSHIQNIDKFIIIIKQRLILQREDKSFLEFDTIKNCLNEYLKLQIYNNIKYRREKIINEN